MKQVGKMSSVLDMLSLRYPLDIQMEMSCRQGISQGSKFLYRCKLKAMKLDDNT